MEAVRHFEMQEKTHRSHDFLSCSKLRVHNTIFRHPTVSWCHE